MPTEKAHGVHIIHMCDSFARDGFSVELLVPDRSTTIVEDPYTYYGVERSFRITRIGTIDAVHLGSLGFLLENIVFSLRAARYAARAHARAVYSREEAPLYFLRWFSSVPAIFELHTARRNFFVRAIARRISLLVVISAGLKEFCIKNLAVFEKNILVAHDGVALEQFTPKLSVREARSTLDLPRDRFIVAYVGKLRTMGMEKGIPELVEAFGNVYQQEQSAFLLLVGANADEVAWAEGLAERACIPRGAFRIVEHVPARLIPPYVWAADVLTITYPDSEHYRLYMSPLKLFEYMAAGKAIIASDLPTIREVLPEDAGVFVPAGGDVAQEICDLIRDPQKVEDLGKRAGIEGARYSWHARAHTIGERIRTL